MLLPPLIMLYNTTKLEVRQLYHLKHIQLLIHRQQLPTMKSLYLWRQHQAGILQEGSAVCNNY